MPLDPSSPATSARRVVHAAHARTTAPIPARCCHRRERPRHRDPRRSLPSADSGVLCTKVARYLERTYSTQRVLHPMRRIGRKGEGRFERIGWDEALDTIARRFAAHRGLADGPEAILPYSYAGTMGLLQSASMDRRFFHRLGASLLDRTICATAGKAGWAATIGASVGMDVEHFAESRLILIWGSNPIASNLHFWTRAQEAKRRGAKLICDRSLPQRHGREMPPAPRAAARDRRRAGAGHDARACRATTCSIDDYVDRLHGGLRGARAPRGGMAARAGRRGFAASRRARDRRPRARLRDARSRRRSASTTACSATPAAATRCGRSPACPRSWAPGAHPAGGALLSSSGTYPVATAALERPDLIAGTPRTSTCRRSAMRCSTRAIRRSARSTSTTPTRSPWRRSRARSRAGFAREDLFCVVHEIFRPTPPTYADILLPATTQLEQTDVHFVLRPPVRAGEQPGDRAAGRGQAQHRGLPPARGAHGIRRAVLRDSDDELARQAFDAARRARGAGSIWDTLKAPRLAAASGAGHVRALRRGQLPDAVGQVRVPLAPARQPRATIRCRPSCRRANRWRATRTLAAAIRWRSSRRRRATSSIRRSPTCRRSSRRSARRGSDINPADAAPARHRDRRSVRILNDRGSFTATARVNDRARPGVVVAPRSGGRSSRRTDATPTR